MGSNVRRCLVSLAAMLLSLLALVACSSSSTPHASAVRRPSTTSSTAVAARPTPGPAADITGPVTGGIGMSLLALPDQDLGAHGYKKSEWFAAGTARSYSSAGANGKDGRWVARPARSALYRTRVVSFVPDRSNFNGTVIVEWLNVTAGFDLANDLAFLSPEIQRSGYAWVGVSAQKVGVDDLVGRDPARYGTLRHPGDAFALDIFSQVGRAVRNGGLKPIGVLQPRHVLAVGQSQSAFALTTYVNAIQATAHIFDGFFVHSRGGGAMRFDGISTANSFSAGGFLLRSDIDVPVLVFETESDEQIGDYFSARQPDTDHIHLWDIAGAAHEDSYRVPSASVVGCKGQVNQAPTHYVAEAALHALNQWVQTGTPPAPAPRLMVKLIGGTPVVQRDALGIAIGGIRTAAIDVPVAAYSGIGTDHSSVNCELIGSTRPFSPTALRHLYPSHAAYIAALTKATDNAITGGYLLPADRSQVLANAQQVHI
jgi:hypothetical protein